MKAKPGDMIYHLPTNTFGKVEVYTVPNTCIVNAHARAAHTRAVKDLYWVRLEIDKEYITVDNRIHEKLFWRRARDIILLDEDTPKNRLIIQLKYSNRIK